MRAEESRRCLVDCWEGKISFRRRNSQTAQKNRAVNRASVITRMLHLKISGEIVYRIRAYVAEVRLKRRWVRKNSGNISAMLEISDTHLAADSIEPQSGLSMIARMV